MARDMLVPSNVFDIYNPQTCMSVYSCDNSVLINRFPGYEGVTPLQSVPVDHCASKLGCMSSWFMGGILGWYG